MPLKLPGLAPGIRLLTEAEIGRLHAVYPESELPDPKNCVTCEGSGSFSWWAHASTEYDPADGDSVEEFECPCVDQSILHRYLLHCGVGLAYQRLDWYDVVADAEAVRQVKLWLADASSFIQAGVAFVLRGDPGTGKTLLGTLALKGVAGLGNDCYFTTFNEMLDFFTSTWRDTEEKKWFYKRVKNARVLGIDDPGKESPERRGSGVPISTLDEVLRHRVAASRPTFIMTNDSDEKMEFRYGGYIASILRERSLSITVGGNDFRDKAFDRLQEERRMGLKRPVTLG